MWVHANCRCKHAVIGQKNSCTNLPKWNSSDFRYLLSQSLNPWNLHCLPSQDMRCRELKLNQSMLFLGDTWWVGQKGMYTATLRVKLDPWDVKKPMQARWCSWAAYVISRPSCLSKALPHHTQYTNELQLMDKNLPNQFGMAKTSQIMGYSPRQLVGQILLWQEGYPNEPKIGKIT